jgi:hypothetical protein
MKDVNGEARCRDQQDLKPIEKRKTEKPRLDQIIDDRQDCEQTGDEQEKKFHGAYFVAMR